MIKLLRNPEVKKTLFLYVLVSFAAVLAAFLWDVSFGFFTLALCLLLSCLYFFTALRRYQRIAELAADIDRLLHGEEQLELETYAEGELAVLQSEIHKMTIRLREQQHNLQKDKLYLADSLADISHQLRTPLTSINLLVSFLSEPDISPERRQKLSCELYALLSRIDWLITSLLKISRLDACTVRFNLEEVSIPRLLEQAVSPLLVPMELRGQTLHILASGTLVCDKAWTCEAVTNIVKNCMEHTPEGGTLEISGTDNSLYTELTIADNGPGIAKEDLPHIFERFYKGKNTDSKNFGIGLALARRIITGQNGTIKAENLTPTGAKFTIRFYKGVV